MKYDAEKLVNELVTLAKRNLNTRLAAIDAEKADGVLMLPVPDEAYFFQDLLHEGAPSFDVLCFYGLEDPETEGIGPATAENHTLYFIVCLKETAETKDFTTRLMRYSRALKEVFERGFTENSGSCKLVISSISPTRFSAEAQGFKGAWRCVGVKVKTSIA